jgi:hypothetical protein
VSAAVRHSSYSIGAQMSQQSSEGYYKAVVAKLKAVARDARTRAQTLAREAGE